MDSDIEDFSSDEENIFHYTTDSSDDEGGNEIVITPFIEVKKKSQNINPMSKYERNVIVSERTKQIANKGFSPLLTMEEIERLPSRDAFNIAFEEVKRKLDIPVDILRQNADGTEEWFTAKQILNA